MNCNRNLYRLSDDLGKVLAVLTAPNRMKAVERYREKCGKLDDVVQVEQLTFGYPEDVCEVYP